MTHNALAVSYAEGVHGMSSGLDSGAAATVEALKRCAAAGGKACEIVGGSQNSCLTAVRSPEPEGAWWTHFGYLGDRRLVEREALEACEKSANGQRCRVMQTVCEKDRRHPGGVNLFPQPGMTYNGVSTPLSAPSGPNGSHHCGRGHRPVLLRLSDSPGSTSMQMHCLPDPGDANARPPTYADAAPVPRGFEWFDNGFGALAADGDSDAAALAINMPTQSDADRQAVARCRSDGGSRCEVVARAQNACLALARGPGELRHGQAGFSQESAEREAVAECSKRAGESTCTLMGAACSYGRFIGLQETPQPEVSYRYTPPPQ